MYDEFHIVSIIPARASSKGAPYKKILLAIYDAFMGVIVCVSKFIWRPNPKRRKINLGGGNWYKKYWENVDLYASSIYIDYEIDIQTMQSLPFENECVEFFFSSHVLEHLDDDVVLNLLKECKRCLNPGGVLRISVPDMDKAFKAYLESDWHFFDSGEISLIGNSLERRLVNFFASYKIGEYSGGPIIDDKVVRCNIESLDKLSFVKWCSSLIPKEAEYLAHINGFNYEKVAYILRIAGFEKIYRSSYRTSVDIEMRGKKFDNRPNSSLFVEAINC